MIDRKSTIVKYKYDPLNFIKHRGYLNLRVIDTCETCHSSSDITWGAYKNRRRKGIGCRSCGLRRRHSSRIQQVKREEVEILDSLIIDIYLYGYTTPRMQIGLAGVVTNTTLATYLPMKQTYKIRSLLGIKDREQISTLQFKDKLKTYILSLSSKRIHDMLMYADAKYKQLQLDHHRWILHDQRGLLPPLYEAIGCTVIVGTRGRMHLQKGTLFRQGVWMYIDWEPQTGKHTKRNYKMQNTPAGIKRAIKKAKQRRGGI